MARFLVHFHLAIRANFERGVSVSNMRAGFNNRAGHYSSVLPARLYEFSVECSIHILRSPCPGAAVLYFWCMNLMLQLIFNMYVCISTR